MGKVYGCRTICFTKAKDYDQYVYITYETTKINVIRDGVSVSVGHMDNLSPQEQAALDTKIKFEYR